MCEVISYLDKKYLLYSIFLFDEKYLLSSNLPFVEKYLLYLDFLSSAW